MPQAKRVSITSLAHGIVHVEFASWKYFANYVTSELSEYSQFIYRGHASPKWRLEPSLDRVLRGRRPAASSSLRIRHLQQFKLAARTRRGSNPPAIVDDNDWWALGQHQGLFTPLLDWTQSPFVAAFFAYEEVLRPAPQRRIVYAIDSGVIEEQSAAIARTRRGAGRPPVVTFLRPMQDENPRLVSQGGLFTRAPDGVDIARWVRARFPRDFSDITLMKLTLPATDRSQALRDLNRMNINRISLFPDLAGASAYCNTALQVDNY